MPAAGVANLNTPLLTGGGAHTFAVDSASDPAANKWERAGSLPGYSSTGFQGPLLSAYVPKVIHEWELVIGILLLAICLAIILMAVSAGVMWWKRRPKGRIGVPPGPREGRIYAGLWAIAAIFGAAARNCPASPWPRPRCRWSRPISSTTTSR